jgi:hypothetical protein
MITPSFSLTATERVLPRLALDFTTASLDPRVTFTRTGNTATVTNSLGLVAPINADLPRFDYDPITLVCKGLLIEEQRTNLFTYSDDFANAAWSKTASSIDSNIIISPDGTLTGDKLITDTTSAAHSITAPALSVTSGTAYTITMYAKKAEKEFLFISFSTNGFTSPTPSYFNLTTGVATAGASVTTVMTSVGNGWYRCAATKTATSTSAGTTVFRIGLTDSNSTATTTGANTTDGLYIWGAQLEAGAFATSYIPTVASTVTRNADVATMTGTNFSDWYNATEGTLFAQASTFSNASTDKFVANINNNGFPNRILMNFSATNNFLASVVSNSVSQVSGTNGVSAALNTSIKMCFATKLDSFAWSQSGVTPTTDTSGAMPVTVDRLWIGSATTSAFLNGHMQRIMFWPQRLTNAEVQAFSK